MNRRITATTNEALKLEAAKAAIRTTLRHLKGDAAHVVVDITRPNQGLAKYLRRVLEDIK